MRRVAGWLFGVVILVGGCVRFGFDGSSQGDATRGDLAGQDAGQVEAGRADGPGDAGAGDGPSETTAHENVVLDLTPDGAGVPGTWIPIKNGAFKMGSLTGEPCRDTALKLETLHDVTLSRGFELSATEVTQGQYELVTGDKPWSFTSCGPDCPVENVSWHEAAAYCNALSKRANLDPCYSCGVSTGSVTCAGATTYSGGKIYSCPGYRLPTEAEWEYAYRAGSTTAFYNGGIASCTGNDANAGAIGWYAANALLRPHPVAQKAPNAWGLYDMAGNVWEWCNDRFQIDLGATQQTDPWGPTSGGFRVGRGGAWTNPAKDMRAAARGAWSPGGATDFIGFRCARSLLP